jgi:predicted YcjX-like family ATPase
MKQGARPNVPPGGWQKTRRVTSGDNPRGVSQCSLAMMNRSTARLSAAFSASSMYHEIVGYSQESRRDAIQKAAELQVWSRDGSLGTPEWCATQGREYLLFGRNVPVVPKVWTSS